MSQGLPFIWKSSLGGVESLGVSKSSQTVLDKFSDMAPACWPHGSVGGGFRKGTMASACLDARHFSFSLYATGAFLAATLALELRGSKSEWVSLCVG